MKDVTNQDTGARSTDGQSADAGHLVGEGGLALRSRTGGSVAFGVRDLSGRRVLAVEIAGEDRGARRPYGSRQAHPTRLLRDLQRRSYPGGRGSGSRMGHRST